MAGKCNLAPRKVSYLARVAWLLPSILLVSGCSSGVAMYPVSGVVRFQDGQPVRNGVVEFRCAETRSVARAKLDETGAFTLSTFQEKDGAPAGDYQVIVVQYFDAPPPGHNAQHAASARNTRANSAPTTTDLRVAPKFASYATTPLRAQVGPGEKNTFDFIVTHPPAR